MITTTIRNALNSQFNHELFSSYFYLAMAAWCDDNGLKGFASWMRVQSQEELSHAMILHNYLMEQNAEVVFAQIDAPKLEAQTVLEVFTAAYEHEQVVTKNFNEIASLCQDERDYATSNFVQFFIDEQVEEESAFRDILDQLKLVGNVGHALFLIDREMGQRSFVMPAKLSEST